MWRPHTGHERVDHVLALLARVVDAAPADQIPPLSQAHQALAETLDSIGEI